MALPAISTVVTEINIWPKAVVTFAKKLPKLF